MITFFVFLFFIILLLIGQRGIEKTRTYENHYGLMALLGVFGAVVTGFVGLFISLGLYGFLVIAVIFVLIKHLKLDIFG